MKAKNTVRLTIEGPKPNMDTTLANVVSGEASRKNTHKLKGDLLLREGLSLVDLEDSAEKAKQEAKKASDDANAKLIQSEGNLLVAQFNLGEFFADSAKWSIEQRRVFVEQGFKAHPFEEYRKSVKGAPKGYDASKQIGGHVMACCLGISQSRLARAKKVYDTVKTRKSLARKVDQCVSSEKVLEQGKKGTRKKSPTTQNIRLTKQANKVCLSHLAPIIRNNIEHETKEVKEVAKILIESLQNLG